jgi:hypothetical protein
LFLLAFPAAAAETARNARPLSDYFPAEMILYVECPDVPAVADGIEGTGLYALWQDPSMDAVRAAVNAAPAPDAASPAAGILTSFRDFISAVPGGIAVGIVDSAGAPEWLAVVQVGPDSSAARAFLGKVYDGETRAGHPPKNVEISGVEVAVSSVDGECSAFAEDVLLLGSRGPLSSALEKIRSDSNELSLSTSIAFTKSVSFLSGACAYRVFIDPARALPALKALLPAEVRGDFDAAVGQIGISDIETVSAEGNFALSGVLERVCISTKFADSRLIDLAGRSDFDEERLRLVPKNVLFASGRALDAKASYAIWKDLEKAYGGPASPSAGLDIVAAVRSLADKSGLDVERDVIPALGRTNIGYFILPDVEGSPAGLFGGMEQAILIEVTDEAAVNSAIDRLAACAQANPALLFPNLPPGSADMASVETATLGTLKITYVNVKGAPIFSPAVAVYKGYLIYGNSKDTVQKAVDNIIAPGSSITDSQDYKRVRGILAAPASQVAYVSIDRAVDILYGLAVPYLGRALDAAKSRGASPVGSDAIPPAYVVKKCIDGIGTSLVASGNLIDVRVYSPTGLFPLCSAVLAAVAAPRQIAALPAAPSQAPPSAPRERLLEIGRRLQLATVDRKGAFPDKLADAVPPELLQAPQDPGADSPVDYIYVPGLTTSSPGKKPLVYERQGLTPDGRYVLFANGSVEFVNETDFPKLIGELQK